MTLHIMHNRELYEMALLLKREAAFAAGVNCEPIIRTFRRTMNSANISV